jgi:glycosyltransferase involved in cell wall biosynthesis
MAAHEHAIEKYPDLHTLMVGDGPHRPWIQSAINLGIPQLHLTGERDPLDVYHAADLLVLPSEREGFSYVCAEALACGTPVLRTRTTGTSETIVPGVTGRSVPIDQESFVEAALEMLGDVVRLRSMRDACAAHARRELGFDRQVRQTLDMYGRLLTLRNSR